MLLLHEGRRRPGIRRECFWSDQSRGPVFVFLCQPFQFGSGSGRPRRACLAQAQAGKRHEVAVRRQELLPLTKANNATPRLVFRRWRRTAARRVRHGHQNRISFQPLRIALALRSKINDPLGDHQRDAVLTISEVELVQDRVIHDGELCYVSGVERAASHPEQPGDCVVIPSAVELGDASAAAERKLLSSNGI